MCRSLEEKAKRNQIMFLRRINDRLSGAVGGKGEWVGDGGGDD